MTEDATARERVLASPGSSAAVGAGASRQNLVASVEGDRIDGPGRADPLCVRNTLSSDP